jgi:arylsulfatase A-like enzyme
MEARVDDGYSEFHWSHHPNENDPINWPTNEYSQWLRKKGLNHTTESIPDSKYVQTSVPAEYHQTTWCAEKAIDFIEHSALFPETPWLFSVNMFDPHHPFDPPKDYLERYMNILDQIPLPNYTEGELDNKPLPQQVEHHNAYCKPDFYPYSKMNDQDHRLIRAAYYAMIDLIDEQVGRIIDSLERTGQMENTLVIFMSDHGEMLGDHGIYLKGPHFYDPAVRVPLIISMPGTVKSGVRTKALVELVDLAPTLLEAAGLPMHPGMQGKSLWPLLRGELDSDFHRKDVYSEYYNSGFKQEQEEYGPFATMIRTDDHKLVVHHGLELGELYDLKLDPEETNNLWNDNDYMEVKLRLFKRLCDRMAWTVDPLPSRVSIW